MIVIVITLLSVILKAFRGCFGNMKTVPELAMVVIPEYDGIFYCSLHSLFELGVGDLCNRSRTLVKQPLHVWRALMKRSS